MFEVEPTPYDRPEAKSDYSVRVRLNKLEALLDIMRPWIKTNQHGYYRLGRSPLFYDENQINIIKDALGE